MRAYPFALFALFLTFGPACGRDRPCRDGTVLVDLQFTDSHPWVDGVSMRYRLDDGPFVDLRPIGRQPGVNQGGLELVVDRYAEHKRLVLQFVPTGTGIPRGPWQERVIDLAPTCTTADLTVAALAPDADSIEVFAAAVDAPPALSGWDSGPPMDALAEAPTDLMETRPGDLASSPDAPLSHDDAPSDAPSPAASEVAAGGSGAPLPPGGTGSLDSQLDGCLEATPDAADALLDAPEDQPPDMDPCSGVVCSGGLSDSCCPQGCNNNDDPDCPVVCGNGVVESGETCDLPASCPTTCDDGNPATKDRMTGTASKCNVACNHTPITACASGDGYCPSGCNHNNDLDCLVVCGNGVVESGETCDLPASCPTSCDDGNPATRDRMTGSASSCNVACNHTPSTACASGDGYCPPGCNQTTDPDCPPVCGNGVVESGETCDLPASCPTSCDDGDSCTIDIMSGSAAQCTVYCSHARKTTCVSGDACCPQGCNSNIDSDCSPTCGNGAVEAGETCDPPGSCPTSCNDGDTCTADQMTGSAANCDTFCGHRTIMACVSGDRCCPHGCQNNNDSDCPVVCGNSVVESGETCDPPASCPTSCNDSNACTADQMIGSAANCNASCSHAPITTCSSGDGCCPSGCNKNNDSDCAATLTVSFPCDCMDDSITTGGSVTINGAACVPPLTCDSWEECHGNVSGCIWRVCTATVERGQPTQVAGPGTCTEPPAEPYGPFSIECYRIANGNMQVLDAQRTASVSVNLAVHSAEAAITFHFGTGGTGPLPACTW